LGKGGHQNCKLASHIVYGLGFSRGPCYGPYHQSITSASIAFWYRLCITQPSNMVQSKNYSLLPKAMYYTSQSVLITIMMAKVKCVLSKRSQFLCKPQYKCITRWWNDFIVKNNCNNACLALFDITCKNFSSIFLFLLKNAFKLFQHFI
jgi:hypothetical protein